MLSENLLTLRRQRRLSQERVAEAIGVSRQAVAKWESGESAPDIENCAALARFYEVTLDDLVNYSAGNAGGLPIPPKNKFIFGPVKLGEKGQIVIPARARRIFGLKPGDDLIVLGDIEQGLALVRADAILSMIAEIKNACTSAKGAGEEEA